MVALALLPAGVITATVTAQSQGPVVPRAAAASPTSPGAPPAVAVQTAIGPLTLASPATGPPGAAPALLPLARSARLDVAVPPAPDGLWWRVEIGPDQRLQVAPDGSIEVIDSAAASSTDSPPTGRDPLPALAAAGARASAPGAVRSRVSPATVAQTVVRARAAGASGDPARNGSPPKAGAAGVPVASITALARDARGRRAPIRLDASGDTIALRLDPRGSESARPVMATITLAASHLTPAHRASFGISTSSDFAFGTHSPAKPFLDYLRRTAGLSTIRVIVPYDVVSDPRRCARVDPPTDPHDSTTCNGLDWYFQELYAYAARRRAPVEVMLALAPDGRSQPGRILRPDSVADYAAGLAAIEARWPWVELYGAWNEPDRSFSGTANDPERAAAYWVAAERLTRRHDASHIQGRCRCTVVAGELGNPTDGYLPGYVAAIRHQAARLPAVWSYHAYSDAVGADPLDALSGPLATTWAPPPGAVAGADSMPAELRAMLAGLAPLGSPRVWMTEGGVQLSPALGSARPGFSATPLEGNRNAVAAWQAARRLLALTAQPRVDRVLYYDLEPGGNDFDSSTFAGPAPSGTGESPRPASPPDPPRAALPLPRPAYCGLVGLPVGYCTGDNRASQDPDVGRGSRATDPPRGIP